MRIKTIPSKWLESEDRRLDHGPYLSGAIEAKELLKKIKTEPLNTLTAGHNGGIFNGPRFPRVYVDDPVYGVPFLGSTDILQADLSNVSLLSKKQVEETPALVIDEGWTLITCSGTTGRMVYARSNMKGMAGSQHFIRVCPDIDKIRPGYLYAYLSSRFGVPIAISGAYGPVVRHIEPHHIAGLPVPRLDDVEERAHELTRQAADLLTEYQTHIEKATDLFFDSVGLKDITPAEWHGWGTDVGFAGNLKGPESLRALNFTPRFNKLRDRIKSGPWKRLGEICVPGSLKRGKSYRGIDAAPEHSYQLIGQKQIFWLRPVGRWIAKAAVGDEVLVSNGTILVALRGTLGETELFCRSEFITGKKLEAAYSEHFLRVIANEKIMPRGCLFAFMRSETAFRMLRSISVGSKLQDHHYAMLPGLPVPLPPGEIRRKIHDLIVEAYKSRDRAIELEDEARELVELAIEEGGH